MSDSVSASFAYDSSGRRAKKTVGGTTTQFLYDGLNTVQELDGNSPPSVIANLLTGPGIDELFSRTDSNGPTNLLIDNLGSTIALTDSTGAVTSNYSYEPFGKTTAGGAASGNPYQFTGRENDGTGLYYYRARYYHPGLQRFISQDPLGFGGGDANLYVYTHNDPTDLTDPLGEFVAPPPTWLEVLIDAVEGVGIDVAPVLLMPFKLSGDNPPSASPSNPNGPDDPRGTGSRNTRSTFLRKLPKRPVEHGEKLNLLLLISGY
jgi:RHS repeat-associated protein